MPGRDGRRSERMTVLAEGKRKYVHEFIQNEIKIEWISKQS